MPIPYFTNKEAANFRLSRALKAAGQDDLHGSFEAEVLREATERAGKTFTTNSFYLPFELLRRDMTTANTGNLVAMDTPFALDALRPSNLPLQFGAQVIRVQADQTIPRVTAASTPYWLAGDGSGQITESQTTIGQVSATPHNCGILTEVSGQLVRQGDIDAFLTRELTRSMGHALASAILIGSGISGQPLGIHSTPDIGTATGAAIAWDDILGMLEDLETANAVNPAFIAPPAVKKLLANRERITGGGRAIWDDGTIDGAPARASTLCPADTLTLADFSQVQILLFGDGLDIVVNPYAGFSTGMVAYRAWLSCDLAIGTPAAFCLATGVS